MAWTAPRTWVTGEMATAALLNTHLRDDLNESGPAKVTAAEQIVRGAGANSLSVLAAGAIGQDLGVVAGPALGWITPAGGTPSSIIAFFDGTICPTGWTEVTLARGRLLVGAGTVGTSVGTALTNQQTRTITGVPSHSHGAGTLASDSISHQHVFKTRQTLTADANKAKWATTQSGTNDTTSAGGHTHTLTTGRSGSAGIASVDVTMPYIQYLVCKKD